MNWYGAIEEIAIAMRTTISRVAINCGFSPAQIRSWQRGVIPSIGSQRVIESALRWARWATEKRP